MMQVRWSLSSAQGGKRKSSSTDYRPSAAKVSKPSAPLGTPLVPANKPSHTKGNMPSTSGSKAAASTSEIVAIVDELQNSGFLGLDGGMTAGDLSDSFSGDHSECNDHGLTSNRLSSHDLLDLLNDESCDTAPAPAPASSLQDGAFQCSASLDNLDNALDSIDPDQWFDLGDHADHDELIQVAIGAGDSIAGASAADIFSSCTSPPATPATPPLAAPKPPTKTSSKGPKPLIWQSLKVIASGTPQTQKASATAPRSPEHAHSPSPPLPLASA